MPPIAAPFKVTLLPRSILLLLMLAFEVSALEEVTLIVAVDVILSAESCALTATI